MIWRIAMKTYLFNPETCVCLGEDIDDDASVKSGSFSIPSNVTTVAPPAGGRGHEMIFDVVAQCWDVHSQW
jgi:hypothetical protein